MKYLVEHIKAQGEKSAIIFQEKEYSYFELFQRIHYYTEKIKEDIPKGSVIALLSDYSFESVSILFAFYENGNIIVPITTTVEKEINERIEIARCDYVIKLENGYYNLQKQSKKESEIHEILYQLLEREHAGLILFSSGTTGKPKAMIHDLDRLIESYRGKRGKNLVFMVFLMFDHIGGLNTMLNCITMGVLMVFPQERDAEKVCELIEKHKVNILPASPTFLNLILLSGSATRYNLNSLKMITYGTEPMPDSLLARLKNHFPSVKFLQTFGTSETGISQMSSKSSNSTYMKFEEMGTETKIVGDELFIRSKTQILGYLNSGMERFTEDGWFKTGDLVEVDSDGYIKIIGRNTQIINVGGEKVLPMEIESVLYTIENIQDCIVYGEPSPITGQMVVAKVMYKGPKNIREIKNEIIRHCREKLEKYKIPVKVVLMSEAEYTSRFKKKR